MTSPSNDRFGIHFGALAEPITVQLKKQKLAIPNCGNDLKHIQADADAVTRLAVRGYVPDGMKRTLHKKLMRRIREVLES